MSLPYIYSNCAIDNTNNWIYSSNGIGTVINPIGPIDSFDQIYSVYPINSNLSANFYWGDIYSNVLTGATGNSNNWFSVGINSASSNFNLSINNNLMASCNVAIRAGSNFVQIQKRPTYIQASWNTSNLWKYTFSNNPIFISEDGYYMWTLSNTLLDDLLNVGVISPQAASQFDYPILANRIVCSNIISPQLNYNSNLANTSSNQLYPQSTFSSNIGVYSSNFGISLSNSIGAQGSNTNLALSSLSNVTYSNITSQLTSNNVYNLFNSNQTNSNIASASNTSNVIIPLSNLYYAFQSNQTSSNFSTFSNTSNILQPLLSNYTIFNSNQTFFNSNTSNYAYSNLASNILINRSNIVLQSNTYYNYVSSSASNFVCSNITLSGDFQKTLTSTFYTSNGITYTKGPIYNATTNTQITDVNGFLVGPINSSNVNTSNFLLNFSNLTGTTSNGQSVISSIQSAAGLAAAAATIAAQGFNLYSQLGNFFGQTATDAGQAASSIGKSATDGLGGSNSIPVGWGNLYYKPIAFVNTYTMGIKGNLYIDESQSIFSTSVGSWGTSMQSLSFTPTSTVKIIDLASKTFIGTVQGNLSTSNFNFTQSGISRITGCNSQLLLDGISVSNTMLQASNVLTSNLTASLTVSTPQIFSPLMSNFQPITIGASQVNIGGISIANSNIFGVSNLTINAGLNTPFIYTSGSNFYSTGEIIAKAISTNLGTLTVASNITTPQIITSNFTTSNLTVNSNVTIAGDLTVNGVIRTNIISMNESLSGIPNRTYASGIYMGSKLQFSAGASGVNEAKLQQGNLVSQKANLPANVKGNGFGNFFTL